MKKPSRPNRSKHIIEAAIDVFLNRGYEKTAMEHLAEAAGCSRQGLYVHFNGKEVIFHQAISFLKSKILSDAQSILVNSHLNTENKLVCILEALHGGTLEKGSRANKAELLELARQMEAENLDDLEQSFIQIIKNALTPAFDEKYWTSLDITSEDAAEHLFIYSSGCKTKPLTQAEYRKKLRTAVRLVLKEQP